MQGERAQGFDRCGEHVGRYVQTQKSGKSGELERAQSGHDGLYRSPWDGRKV